MEGEVLFLIEGRWVGGMGILRGKIILLVSEIGFFFLVYWSFLN